VPEVRARLLAMSAATIDRALQDIRRQAGTATRRRSAPSAGTHAAPVTTRCAMAAGSLWRSGSILTRASQAVVEQTREAEMLQAIDRLRLVHSARGKTVYILCSIPLDLPVDELVTWKQLVGDKRLMRALETCEENGWEALLLAAKELHRLFPELWRTRKAAEDWARTRSAWTISAHSPLPGTYPPEPRRRNPANGCQVRAPSSSARCREGWAVCRSSPRIWG